MKERKKKKRGGKGHSRGYDVVKAESISDVSELLGRNGQNKALHISKIWTSLPTTMWHSREIVNLDFISIFHRTFLNNAKLAALPHILFAAKNPLYKI